MVDHPTWAGVAQGLLVLGVLWWAWTGYAWLTSVIDPEEGIVRLLFFVAMARCSSPPSACPTAFGSGALLFACAYGVVRGAHIALFLIASRDDPQLRRSVVGLAGQHADRHRLAARGRARWAAARAGRCGCSRSAWTWPGRTSSAPTAGSSCPATSPSATG